MYFELYNYLLCEKEDNDGAKYKNNNKMNEQINVSENTGKHLCWYGFFYTHGGSLLKMEAQPPNWIELTEE